MATVCGSLAWADEEIEPESVIGGLSFREQVEVTVVNIDVFVRDDDGNPVTGLDADDFRVFQDGISQRISHFAAFSEEVISAVMSREPTDGDTPPPLETLPDDVSPSIVREDIQPVSIILYIDNENIQPLDRTRVLKQVRQFVNEIMLPHVRVMVVSGGRSMKVVQPFTNDTKLIRDALRSMGTLAGARVELDGQRREIIGDLQRHIERGRSDRRDDYTTRSLIEGDIRTYGEQLVMELDQSVARIREAAFMVAGLPGRKIMVHVSSGLPMVAAKDLINHYDHLFEGGNILPMLSRFDRRNQFRSLAATANAQGLSFYMIDATGLTGAAGVSAEHSRPVDPMVSAIHVNNLQEPLLYMADSTGGRALLDSNDVTEGLFGLKEDLFTYYSVGYTVSTSGGDVVHRVKVELPDHPDYEVLHRRTLVERSRETEVQDTVANALAVNIDDNPMGIAFDLGAAVPGTEDRWMVPVEISVHGCDGSLVAWASSPRMDHQRSERRPHGGQDAHRTMGSIATGGPYCRVQRQRQRQRQRQGQVQRTASGTETATDSGHGHRPSVSATDDAASHPPP
jgi:VWFA-related protein